MKTLMLLAKVTAAVAVATVIGVATILLVVIEIIRWLLSLQSVEQPVILIGHESISEVVEPAVDSAAAEVEHDTSIGDEDLSVLDLWVPEFMSTEVAEIVVGKESVELAPFVRSHPEFVVAAPIRHTLEIELNVAAVTEQVSKLMNLLDESDEIADVEYPLPEMSTVTIEGKPYRFKKADLLDKRGRALHGAALEARALKLLRAMV